MLLSNALLSYLLPTSLLHTTQHYSIPRPSSRSLRLVSSLNALRTTLPSTTNGTLGVPVAPLEGRDPSRYLGAFTLPKSSSIRTKGTSRRGGEGR